MNLPDQHNEALSILREMTSLDAKPADLTAKQLTEIRNHLNEDLFAFAWIVFGYTDLDPQLHGQICTLLARWGTDPSLNRLIIQIPRGHLKTSLCTIANSLWQICRDPDHTVCIVNEKEDNTGKWIRAIKERVAGSEIFHRLYPDILPPGLSKKDRNEGKGMPRWWKWSDTELLFERGTLGIPEASITGLGLGSASAGGHWNKIIKDDLISEDAAHQPATMERAKDWVDNSYYLEKPALGGQDLIACTPWGYRDVYAYALGRYDYSLYRRSALENDRGEPDTEGHPIFPAKFTKESILAMRGDGGTDYHWWAQMMCRPRPGKETAFQPEWLRYFDILGDVVTIHEAHYNPETNPARVPEIPQRAVHLSMMTKALIVDPAPSEDNERRKEPGARNAFVMMGHDWWGRRYILETKASRDNPSDVIDTMISMCEKWECDTVGIEEVVFSLIYRYWLEERAKRKKLYLRAFPIKPGRRDKDKRIRQKTSALQEGIYFIEHANRSLFLQEYMEYPYGATRDILDAWAYDDEPGLLPRPNSPDEIFIRGTSSDDWRRRYTGISPLTGY